MSGEALVGEHPRSSEALLVMDPDTADERVLKASQTLR